MKKKLETLLKLGAFAGLTMYGINKLVESSALNRNLLPNADGTYFKWSQGSVFYKKYGKGTPVVLLHELDPAASGYEWNEIVSDLAQKHTVYILDLPGCGRSGKITQETYINYYYVRCMKEFVDNVIGEKTSVIASGYSCSFVIMAASIHEDIFDKITLINPYHPSILSAPVNTKSKLIKALINVPVLGTFLYYMEYSREQLEFRFTEKLFFNPFNVTRKMIHTYYESAHILKGNGKYLLSSLRGNYLSVNVERSFSGLKNPITLIFGKELGSANAVNEAYQKLNPNARTIFISKAKMLPQLECPEKLLHYI